MSAPAAAARRPARARGLPLAPARRRRCGSTPTRARTRRRPSSSTRWLDELRGVAAATATPTAARASCATRSAQRPRPAGRAALLRERLERGAPDAAAHLRRARASRLRVRAHRTRCTRHIARITGTEVVVGGADAPTSPSIPTAARALVGEHRPADRVRVQPQQPDRHGRAARRPSRRCSTSTVDGLVVVDEAYGEFADRGARSSSCATTAPLVVVRTYSKVWSMAALRLGFAVAPAVGRRASSRRSCCRTTSPRPPRSPGRLALELRRRRWTTASHALVAERERLAAAARGDRPASRCSRRAPTSCCSCACTATATRCWQRLVDRGVLVRDFSRWPRLEDCLRVTIGTPEENDAFLAALRASLPGGREPDDAAASKQQRTTKETTIELTLDVDGGGRRVARRPASRSSTTCSSSSASTAGSTCAIDADGRPRGRPPPHRRGRRHRARHRAQGGARRQGRRAPLRRRRSCRSTRRSCRSRSTSRAARSSSTRSIRSPSGSAPSTRSSPRSSGGRSRSAPGSRCTSGRCPGRNGHHVIEASFKGVARALRDAVKIEGTGVPSTKGTL